MEKFIRSLIFLLYICDFCTWERAVQRCRSSRQSWAGASRGISVVHLANTI